MTVSTSVHSGYVVNNGIPLFYHEWGSPDAPALLFLGPLRAAAYYWKPIAEQLADRFHCIALNLRAHCDSGSMLRACTDIDLYVTDIAATIETLKLERPVVVAFAPMLVGAGVAFAANHPDMLRGLVIIDGGPGLKPEVLPMVKQRQISTPAAFDTWDDALVYLRTGAAAPVQALTEERAPYVFRYRPDGKVEWKYDPVLREEWMGENPPAYVGKLPSSIWEKVKAPMYFIVPAGGSINLPLTNLAELKKYGELSESVEVPNSQHFIHEENPSGFMEAFTPFLRRIYG
jgi:pimeloyl-ACP methyl ester carboxylesterase